MRIRISTYVFCLIFIHVSLVVSQTPGTLKWKFTTKGSVTSPAVSKDGRIYIGVSDKNLYALNRDGQQQWVYTTGGSIQSSPSIGGDGTVYVGSNDKKLYAIKSDGSKKWEFITEGEIISSPAIASDGTIYIKSGSQLYAIMPDGNRKWQIISGWSKSSPAIGVDGTIYIGDNNFSAFYPDGSIKWKFKCSSQRSSPAIDENGTIYIGSDDGKIYAINPDGSQKWSLNIGTRIDSAPTIGPDGSIYIGANLYRKTLNAINQNGNLVWSFNAGWDVRSSPSIGSDSILYVGSDSYDIYAINPKSTRLWSYNTGWLVDSSPSIDSNGTLYVGGYDGLYALYSSSKGLANSSWPRSHYDNRNTAWRPSALLYDVTRFIMQNNGSAIQKSFELSNPFSSSITVQSCQLSNPNYSLITSIPLTINNKNKQILTVNIIAENSEWIECIANFTYLNINRLEKAIGTLNTGVFINDNTEKSLIAKRAIDAYNACKAKDPTSYATLNNLSVLYRLLNQSALAESNLMAALSKSINVKDSYTGIKMNMGVVKSDQNNSSDANTYYDLAINDISSSASVSSLAPQIYYNKAWEAYRSKTYSDALTQVNKTIQHVKVGSFLKAKAFALRGAIHFQQNNLSAAKADWQQVLSLDPTGPIGNLAQYNMQFLNQVKIPLRTGWNLVSWNIDTANDSTKALLDDISNKVIVVLGYESGGQTYDPKLAHLSTLPFMDHLHGYWIKMSSTDTLRLYGPTVDYATTSITCESGWNLVSYLPTQADSISHGFSTVINNMTVALGYNGAGQTFVPQLRSFSTLKVLAPYLGYWLRLNQPANLLYPRPLSGIKPAMSITPMLAKSSGDDTESLAGFINPSNEWINLYGQNIVYQGGLLAIGTEVKAKDLDGVECGSFTVRQPGVFGLMPVYRDDPNTEADEGAKPGEEINLYFGNDKVPVSLKWTEMGDVIDVGNKLAGVESGQGLLPERFALSQNYPNPFNPQTTIRYQLPRDVHVTLKVYNMLGQEMITLVDQQTKAGYHQAVWDGRDQRGSKAGSGLYIYTLKAGEFQETKKMMLLY